MTIYKRDGIVVPTEKIKEIDSILSNKNVIVGGDGTYNEYLSTFEYGKIPFFYAINFGKVGNNLPISRDYDLTKPFKTLKRTRISLKSIKTDNNKKVIIKNTLAANEFVVKTEGVVLNKFSLHGFGYVLCDGVIICTPLGSTGYNSSLGGPLILENNLKDFGVLFMAPYKPKVNPLVLNNEITISISNGLFDIYRDGVNINLSCKSATFEIGDTYELAVPVEYNVLSRLYL